MAIAFDAKAQSTASAADKTFSHTCTGSNLVLYVAISNNSTSDGISGVTYNSLAMTRVGTSSDGLGHRGYLYRLFNPPTGAHNVVVTRSNSDYICATSASYSGVAQGTTNFASNIQTSNASTNVNTLTTLVANCWLVSADVNDNGAAPTAGTGAYLRQIGANIFNALFDSNGAIASAGSTSMTINQNTGNLQAATIMEAMAPADLTIALDATSQGGEESASSKTWSHTCTGTNRILFVSGYIRGNGVDVTGITYNGVAMTAIGTSQQVSTNYYDKLFTFYLLAPATGAHNIVASFNGTNYSDCNAVSYTGVSQTSFPNASTTSGPTGGTSQTVSLTSTTDNCWMILCAEGSNGNLAGGTGTTFRAGAGNPKMWDTNGAVTPAGSRSMTFTYPNGTSVAKMVSFAPYVAPIVQSGFFPMMLQAA